MWRQSRRLVERALHLARTPRRMVLTILLAALCVYVAEPPAAPACGPNFPSSIIFDDHSILEAPVAMFEAELDRISVKDPVEFKAVEPSSGSVTDQSNAAEGAELKRSLEDMKVPAHQIAVTVKNYLAARAALQAYKDELDEIAGRQLPPGSPGRAPPVFPNVTIPAGLPAEFDDYLRGLIALRRGETDVARTHWQRLLDRPAAERRFRSTWAAFMLGRMLHDSPDDARKAFAICRRLVKEGFADSIGLAAASIGWEAQLEFQERNYKRAIELYMRHRATGDSSATTSLRWVCNAIFEEPPDVLKDLARDPLSRRVLTGYAVSSDTPYWPGPANLATGISKWLEAIESISAQNLDGADRMAWAAYRAGDMQTTDRWLKRAPADSGLARWIESKLLLRAGKLDEAARVLALAVHHLPEAQAEGEDLDTEWERDVAARLSGNLGAVQLARGNFADALDLLIKGNYFHDAGYVAERILTADELKSYVDHHWPTASPKAIDPTAARKPWDHFDRPGFIRHLLARRLARIGRLKDAGPYFPVPLRPKFDEYVRALHEGRDKSRTAFDRSTALWQAARIARKSGMELLGTEIEPDCFEYGGRFGPDFRDPPAKPRAIGEKILPPTAEEQNRFNSSAPMPNTRFHYRYIAANLGWEAADLMPDEQTETAKVLCTAGGWIETRDPKAAKRFYDALVTRCPTTEIGRRAIKERWLPAIN